MTKQEIEKQIMEEYVAFENQIYSGSLPVPENIISIFKNGVMAQAQQVHKVHATKIKVIASKRFSELTNGDVNTAIIIIVNTPIGKLYPGAGSFKDAIELEIKFEKFVLSYNNHIAEFQKNLEMKKVRLESLATGPQISRVPPGSALRSVT